MKNVLLGDAERYQYPTSDIARCFGWLFEKVLNKWCGGVIVT